MAYDFDKFVDRKNTNSLKYDFALERNRPSDILPLWVADMDFPLPDEVLSVMQKCVSHGIFGYSEVKDDYFKTLDSWFKKYFSYSFDKKWLVKTPGVVYAIATAIKAYTNIGDSVLIQTPVYYPFSECINDNERTLIDSPLLYLDGKYSIDFQDFEKKIIENQVKLFILCSPHNPVGRVWAKDELIKICDICLKHNVHIVSDEIHMDFTRNGYTHHILPSISDTHKYDEIVTVLTAPSKTFNIAGLQISNIFIPNDIYREKFIHEINKTGYSQLNTIGLVTAKACYDYGDDWLFELKKYLEENLSFIRSYLEENLPKLKLVEPEGTYLAWVDFSELNLSTEKVTEIMTHDAKVWLDSGDMFGKSGCFQRINYACARRTLEEALNRINDAFKNL